MKMIQSYEIKYCLLTSRPKYYFRYSYFFTTYLESRSFISRADYGMELPFHNLRLEAHGQVPGLSFFHKGFGI